MFRAQRGVGRFSHSSREGEAHHLVFRITPVNRYRYHRFARDLASRQRRPNGASCRPIRRLSGRNADLARVVQGCALNHRTPRWRGRGRRCPRRRRRGAGRGREGAERPRTEHGHQPGSNQSRPLGGDRRRRGLRRGAEGRRAAHPQVDASIIGVGEAAGPATQAPGAGCGRDSLPVGSCLARSAESPVRRR